MLTIRESQLNPDIGDADIGANIQQDVAVRRLLGHLSEKKEAIDALLITLQSKKNLQDVKADHQTLYHLEYIFGRDWEATALGTL